MTRLGEAPPTEERPPGARVVLDVRPLQEPHRAPTTAIYLDALLRAFAADALPGESFVVLAQAGLPDPTAEDDVLARLPVVARRPLPPTRLLRAGALTTDPFILRSGSIGVGWGRGPGDGIGPVFHTASGAVPIASRLPVVVTLLDLAPWELPDVYQRSPAARFGQRLRARILRDAAVVIVPSAAAARSARRLLHVRPGRLRVVPLAGRPEFAPGAAASVDAERARLGLPGRYLVYPGRYDARQDLATLLRALADLAATPAPRPGRGRGPVPWPPRVVLVDASPDDRAEVARLAARHGVGELLSYVPHLEAARLAAVTAGSRAAVLPVVSSTAALPAVEAIAAGVPVVASAVGSLPEAVGRAGLLVEPRDPARLAAAIATAWGDDAIHAGLAAAAAERATAADRRTWADVARETRRAYAAAAAR